MLVDTKEARAVNAARFHNFGGDFRVVVAEDQGRDGNAIDDVTGDQTGHGACKADRAERLYEGDEDALVGDEHPKQHQRKNDLRAGETPLRQHITIHRPHQRRENRRVQGQ